MKRVANCLVGFCRRSRFHLHGKHLKPSAVLMSVVRHSSGGTRRVDVSGIYPPIATPFNKDESVAYDKLTENMQKWNKIPFGGYVVQGSNGEYVYQTPEERIKVVEYVAKTATSDKVIMAGSGCESTRDTIEMTNQMADVGAHAALVVTPSYYKNGMHNRALIIHFTKVADASKIPILLYSVPGNTGIDLDPEVIITLSSHPNIIGLKDSGGDIAKLANLVYKTQGKDFQIMAGSAGFLLPAYLVGCVGGVCGAANMLGQELCDLEQLYKEGKMKEPTILQQRIVAPNACVTKRFGVPGLKVAMEWFGYYGGPVRSPLQPITTEQEEIMRTVFKSSGFLT
ncbi:4-hydroxy-2-oxoglutarate aldolase, mitochondrial-like [Saccostrea cucullata]|uniref:4-hydroxy-2-oxoglutarate aldolase, mitochondrial-like n=1 Tax=Saccostrea cuccullata TaxID=36930 RepID=UPI002ED511B2